MKNVNGLLMTWDEYDDLIGMVSNGEAGIASESGEWFYVSSEEYLLDDVYDDLSAHFNRRVRSVVIDINSETEDCVVIIFE